MIRKTWSRLTFRSARRVSSNGLPPERLGTLWAHYDLPKPLAAHPLGLGMTKAMWEVPLSGNGRVVVCRYPEWFSEARVGFEHAVVRHLRTHDFPTPDVVPTRAGGSFVNLDGSYYAFFEYCEGDIPAPTVFLKRLRADVNVAGAFALAWYHQIMDRFQSEWWPGWQSRDIHWLLEQLQEDHKYLSRQTVLTRFDRYVLRHFDMLEHRLVALGGELESSKSAYPHTVIHGDFGPHNLLFRNRRLIGVLDLTNARRDPRVEDVAYALIPFSKWSGVRLHLGTMRAFLYAYHTQYPLSHEEFELLPRFMLYSRLGTIRWTLRRYCEQPDPYLADRFIRNVKLVRWLEASETKVRTLCREIEQAPPGERTGPGMPCDLVAGSGR